MDILMPTPLTAPTLQGSVVPLPTRAFKPTPLHPMTRGMVKVLPVTVTAPPLTTIDCTA